MTCSITASTMQAVTRMIRRSRHPPLQREEEAVVVGVGEVRLLRDFTGDYFFVSAHIQLDFGSVHDLFVLLFLKHIV